MADDFMNLDELDARSRNRKAKIAEGKESVQIKKEPECPAEVVKEEVKQPVELVPSQPKAIGGRPKTVTTDMTLTPKDVEVLTLLATGAKKTAIADMVGISRAQLYKLLETDRVKKIMSNSRNRLEALTELAVEVVHKELLEGNVEVAQSLLKGLGAMKVSVNNKDGKKVERSIAEEIMDADGTTTRRVIKERENDSDE